MPYYEKASKADLREFQLKAAAKRNECYALRYAEALSLFEQNRDINVVAQRFNIKTNAAYKMVKKGKEQKSVKDNTV